jgi:hypothetical protein
VLTPDEFLAEARKLHNFIGSHSRLCADYINQYWLERDGRFANARVHMFGEGEGDGRHIIVSNMKNGYPPDGNSI